jgi:hypothetical protein
MAEDRVEGKFDETGTLAKVVSPGHYEASGEEEGASPEAYADIEHGSGPQGLRRLGKKFVHLTSRLRKHYGTTKKAA